MHMSKLSINKLAGIGITPISKPLFLDTLSDAVESACMSRNAERV